MRAHTSLTANVNKHANANHANKLHRKFISTFVGIFFKTSAITTSKQFVLHQPRLVAL